jgi:hypothetical protein
MANGGCENEIPNRKEREVCICIKQRAQSVRTTFACFAYIFFASLLVHKIISNVLVNSPLCGSVAVKKTQSIIEPLFLSAQIYSPHKFTFNVLVSSIARDLGCEN